MFRTTIEIEKCALVLNQIAHPVRLDIIQTLAKFENLTIEELNDYVKVDQHLLKYHTSTLKITGILKRTYNKEGKISYSLGTVIRDSAKLINSLNLLTNK